MATTAVLGDTYFRLPTGTTGERPTGVQAMTRINTTTGNIEYYNGANWVDVNIFSPLSLSGLIGWYDTASVSGTTWIDKSGLGNNATISGATVAATSGNGASLLSSALYGSSSTHNVVWSSAILPSASYTLFHVTRYTGLGARLRIFTMNTGTNWLSGHHNGNTGVAYHDGWLTATTDIHGNNWFISTDQKDLYRSNGVTRGSSGSGSPGYAGGLTINTNTGEITIGWQCAEVIVYNRILSASEYGQIEIYLASRYGITLG